MLRSWLERHGYVVASIIEEEATLADVVTLLKLREGEVSVTELTVAPGSKIVGKAMKEIEMPERCLVAAILRGTDILVPSGDLRIESKDELLFVSHPDAEAKLRDLVQ